MTPTQVAVVFLQAILCIYNYTHNSRTKGRLWSFYVSSDCSTIGDIYMYSLCLSCTRDTICKLWIQKHITTTLRYVVSCVVTLVTRKLQVVCTHSTYRKTDVHRIKSECTWRTRKLVLWKAIMSTNLCSRPWFSSRSVEFSSLTRTLFVCSSPPKNFSAGTTRKFSSGPPWTVLQLPPGKFFRPNPRHKASSRWFKTNA